MKKNAAFIKTEKALDIFSQQQQYTKLLRMFERIISENTNILILTIIMQQDIVLSYILLLSIYIWLYEKGIYDFHSSGRLAGVYTIFPHRYIKKFKINCVQCIIAAEKEKKALVIQEKFSSQFKPIVSHPIYNNGYCIPNIQGGL